jgi:hypothetical protein
MNKSWPKEMQIRNVPKDLAKFLARPDFGSFLCEFSGIDRAIAMQLDTQSVSARALYLMLAGYSSLMEENMERPQPPHVSPKLLTTGLSPFTPLAKSIVFKSIPHEIRVLMDADSFSEKIADPCSLDAWTAYQLDNGSPTTRVVFLIYEGVSTLMTKGRTRKALGGHPQAILTTTHGGTGANPEDIAKEAAGTMEAQEGAGGIGSTGETGFKSLLPEDSPVWNALSKK